jgi:hypothetical protein
MGKFVEITVRFLPLLTTVTVVVAVLLGVNYVLRRRWKDDPDAQFRFQLIMLALTFAGLLAVVVSLPVDDALRGQLLSLIGILLSAAIALSSTTFIGNVMAGIMLKAVRSARPGDFITVADLTGRITEMDLLHTEIQTEFRDLVTVPNLYMVTQPLRVVRASGSIITAEVSLGYEIPHSRVSEILRDAAGRAGLKDGFVHVRELGDFSVTYRVAGLLEDIQSLISARSLLRAAMLDALHEAGIEIVSPSFMNTRAIREGQTFIPTRSRPSAQPAGVQAEEIAFDKAEEAASAEKIRIEVEKLDAELAALAEAAEHPDEKARERIENRKAVLVEQLKALSEQIKAEEL